MIYVRGSKLEFFGKEYDCAIGKNGFADDKREGDLKTPIGEFELRRVFYRADKGAEPECVLEVFRIAEDDGWCDDAEHEKYNQLVKLPLDASHEKLWREDGLYDVFLEIGYNDSPAISGKGSAVFMHIAKPNYEGTEGCVALKKEDLLEVLHNIKPDTKILIASK